MTYSYKQKLEQFNSTEKYAIELAFLHRLLGETNGALIMDYGCGIGNAVKYLSEKGRSVAGYDKTLYFKTAPDWFGIAPAGTTYFMHSIAHIEDIEEVLSNTRGKVVVITPNLSWLNKITDNNYEPDTTVISHFNAQSLHDLFKDAGFRVSVCGQFGKIHDGQNERLFLMAYK